MGYQHRYYLVQCAKCNTKWLFSPVSWSSETKLPITFTCKSCGAKNTTASPNLIPNVPRELYCGHEKHRQLHLYPFPPSKSDNAWAFPYSARSFVSQTSRELGGCAHNVHGTTEIFGEPAYED